LNREKNVTLVIATHDRDFSDNAARRLNMQDGKLL